MIDRSISTDVAAVPADYALSGCQAYSRAFKLFGGMQALEHPEQLICILHIEACAIVYHENF